MYKVVVTHEILPSKILELKAWLKRKDEEIGKQDPTYTPYKRYLTVFGNMHQLT